MTQSKVSCMKCRYTVTCTHDIPINIKQVLQKDIQSSKNDK